MAVDCAPTVSSSPLAPSQLFRLTRSAAILAVVVVALDQLGVAGYQAGEIIVAALLALAGATAAWLLLRGRRAAGLWTVSAAVLATLLTPVLVARAPWSLGRLQAELDSMALPFAERVDETTSGHSWCRPTCPVVVRTYRGPAINPLAAAREIAAVLTDAGLAPAGTANDITGGDFSLRSDDVRIEVHAEPESDDVASRILVTIHVASRR